ncbi:MAG: glucuronate isomerase [Bacillota bacterium]|nr:glucuronate isomerase [Bacillota bacterium]
MKEFMDKDFLLETETAKHLFHDYAENMPIVDYHCHISPKEIYEDRKFDSLDQVWIGGKNPDGSYFGDHYKWRVMRSNGVNEEFITGSKSGKEKIQKFAESLEKAIGNPMYHWTNLELSHFFGFKVPLTAKNAAEAFDFCNDKLQNDPSMTVRGLIKQSKVAFIGTTDDPIDSLEWHEKIREDKSFETIVAPSFRPDKAINISKEGFAEYVGKLAASVGKESLDSAEDVLNALVNRLEFFVSMGCKASDHGLDYIPYRPGTYEEINKAFTDVMGGKEITLEAAEKYQTYILTNLAKQYHKNNVVMQLHYSCYRNANERIFKTMGPDTGVDMIAITTCGSSIAQLLSELDLNGECPKTILYSLNPADNQQIDTMLGCFQSDEIPGKIQHGSGWWFNDTKSGMEEQMKSLANLGLLGNFVGMLTDSRSFLSYTRHDYFRRIMCNLIGNWVENGEFPNDDEVLKDIVEGICYNNAKRYFGL